MKDFKMARLLVSFLLWLIGSYSLVLGGYTIYDLILTSIIFIFSGEFSSFLSASIAEFSEVMGVYPDDWQMNTPFNGIDRIINYIIAQQYSFSGRLYSFFISAGIGIVIIAASVRFDFELIVNSRKNKDDISVLYYIALLLFLPILAPTVIGSLGGIFIMLEFISPYIQK